MKRRAYRAGFKDAKAHYGAPLSESIALIEGEEFFEDLRDLDEAMLREEGLL